MVPRCLGLTDGGDGSVGPLVEMLERLWRGNVCRHGGLVYRDQTLDEARAALQLAVTCVQWLSTTQRAQALAKAARRPHGPQTVAG